MCIQSELFKIILLNAGFLYLKNVLPAKNNITKHAAKYKNEFLKEYKAEDKTKSRTDAIGFYLSVPKSLIKCNNTS